MNAVLRTCLLAAIPLAVLVSFPTGPLVAAEASEGVSAELIDGPEFLCNNCYDQSYCDEGVLFTWQNHGAPDAVVLAIGSTPECVYVGDDTCADLIACSEDAEWDSEDTKMATLLEEALDAADYQTAAALVEASPEIGTFVPERGVVIVRASQCVGGVRAVIPVGESFALAL